MFLSLCLLYNYSTKKLLHSIQAMSNEEVATLANWVNNMNKRVINTENKLTASAQSALWQKRRVSQDVINMSGEELGAVAQFVEHLMAK